MSDHIRFCRNGVTVVIGECASAVDFGRGVVHVNENLPYSQSVLRTLNQIAQEAYTLRTLAMDAMSKSAEACEPPYPRHGNPLQGVL